MWRIKSSKRELDFYEVKQLIYDSKKLGVKLLHIAGGEPTLVEFLPKIIKEASKIGLPTALTTNASKLTPRYIQKLENSGLKNFTISIDSPKSNIHDSLRGMKGAFDKASNAIKSIQRINPKISISINCVINKRNYKNLIDLASLAKKLKVSSINFLPIQKLYPLNYYLKQNNSLYFNTVAEVKQLEYELKRLVNYLGKNKLNSMSKIFFNSIPSFYRKNLPMGGCSGGNIVCEVDSYGDVYPCYGSKLIAGNIRDHSIREIWNSKKFNKVRKKLQRCKKCWDNCQVEPKIRFSLKYLMTNLATVINEYKRYIN